MVIRWADIVQPLVAGLAAMLGVYLTEAVLGALRRRCICPDRWKRARSFLKPSGESRRRSFGNRPD